MTPGEFKRAWNERSDVPLIVFPPSAFEGTSVSPTTRQFLTEAGLPEAAGPFLMIDKPGAKALISAAEMWELPSDYADYWVIGTNASGDPVVLRPDDAVVYLNHDDDFREVYINRNVAVLAEMSLRFPGIDATDAEKTTFVAFLADVDADALADGSFWKYAWSNTD